MVQRITYIFFLILTLVLLSCGNREKTKEVTNIPTREMDEQVYLEKGGEITGIVFKSMSGKLKQALEQSGVKGAVAYCNLAASPLVDSLSRAHAVRIKRTSTNLRNPENAPDEMESKILNQYLAMTSSADLPEPRVVFSGTDAHYYAPIFLMDACLKCHGTIHQDIIESDYAVIKNLYPTDQATGYQVGELRGIWSLTFDRNQ